MRLGGHEWGSVPHAEAAEQALSGAEDALSGPGDLSGQWRIGAPDGCANYLLPQVCARICESCAQECMSHAADHCQDCAEACKRCASLCRDMLA